MELGNLYNNEYRFTGNDGELQKIAINEENIIFIENNFLELLSEIGAFKKKIQNK